MPPPGYFYPLGGEGYHILSIYLAIHQSFLLHLEAPMPLTSVAL